MPGIVQGTRELMPLLPGLPGQDFLLRGVLQQRSQPCSALTSPDWQPVSVLPGQHRCSDGEPENTGLAEEVLTSLDALESLGVRAKAWEAGAAAPLRLRSLTGDEPQTLHERRASSVRTSRQNTRPATTPVVSMRTSVTLQSLPGIKY